MSRELPEQCPRCELFYAELVSTANLPAGVKVCELCKELVAFGFERDGGVEDPGEWPVDPEVLGEQVTYYVEVARGLAQPPYPPALSRAAGGQLTETIDQVRTIIERHLEELAAEERRLRRALAAMGPTPAPPATEPTEGFTFAGPVEHDGLNLAPDPLPDGKSRHRYGVGPFARLIMPELPNLPGLYLWTQNGEVVYVGQTRTPLRKRLGPQGYARITNYNTYASAPGKSGGQQTNCRVNALANRALLEGNALEIWYRTTSAKAATEAEREWMSTFGRPSWNLRHERDRWAAI